MTDYLENIKCMLQTQFRELEEVMYEIFIFKGTEQEAELRKKLNNYLSQIEETKKLIDTLPFNEEKKKILKQNVDDYLNDTYTRAKQRFIVKNEKRKTQLDAASGVEETKEDTVPEVKESIPEATDDDEDTGELFRMLSFEKIGTSTVQSRALAGVAGGTYLFALPGSTSACKDGWDDILRYQLDIRHRPCNFVEIMPRLNESATTRRTG